MVRNINIKPVLNGFIVEVGCKTLVMPSKNTLLIELARYLDNPSAVENEYRKNALFDNDSVPESVGLRMRDDCDQRETVPPSSLVGTPVQNR